MAIAETIEVKIGARAMYEASLKKAQDDFDRYGKAVVTVFAKIKAAQLALTGAADLMEKAAKFDQQEQAFTNLAASYGASARQIISDLQAMSGQTISTAALMESAGSAMLLGIPADQLSQMMEIARASAKITGDSVEKAFADIGTGISRQSPMILDNLGITIKLSTAYEQHAVILGKTTSQLTEQEKKQAFVNAAMNAGQDIVKRVGSSTLSAADAMAIMAAKWENAKIIAGKVLISISGAASGIATGISMVFAGALGGMAKLAAAVVGLLSGIPLIGDTFKAASESIEAFADFEFEAANIAEKMADSSFNVAAAIWKEKEAVEGLQKTRSTTDTEDVKKIAPEESPEVLAIKTRMLYRDQEIAQMTELSDVMAFHMERMMPISEAMAAQMIVDNQRIAWSNQAKTNIVSKANDAMTDSMLGLIETGRFSVGAFAQIMAQQVKIELAGIAAKASVRALYELGLGFATSFVNPVESAGHFAAAGQLALVAGASVAAGAAVNAVAGGTAERPAPGTAGGEPVRTRETGTSPLISGTPQESRQVQTVSIQIHALDPSTINWDKYSENIVESINRAGKERDVKIQLEAVAA